MLAPALTNEDEEAAIRALLEKAVADTPAAAVQSLMPPPPPAPPPLPPPNARDLMADARDIFVLDAALGEGGWSIEVSMREVDYCEQELHHTQKCVGGGWTAQVSYVLSLFRHESSQRIHLHDETGSGRANNMQAADAATALAEQRAYSGARRRLAKRFAFNLEPAQLADIERRASGQPSGVGPLVSANGNVVPPKALMQQFGGGKPKR